MATYYFTPKSTVGVQDTTTRSTAVVASTVTSTSLSGNLQGGTVVGTTALFSGAANISNANALANNSNTIGSSTGSLTLAGDLHLYNTTNPLIAFSAAGTLAAPSFTNRSQGTRVLISPNISSTATDYAIGVEPSNVWFCTSQTTTGFKWYGGSTLSATLGGDGALTIAKGLAATTGVFSGAVSMSALTATTGNFSGSCLVATPSVAGHATTKAYVDGLTFLTAGTGLTLASGSLSVNANQTQITSVGTLTSLAVTGSLSSGALSSTTGTFSGIATIANTTKLANTSNTVNATSGSLTLAGDLHVYHATNPQLVFFTGTTTAPTFTTRSAGTRVILFPNISSTTVDYAMGMESGNLWLSTGQTTTGFKWYGGTTLSASLSGAGQLTLTQGLSATTGVFSGTVNSAAPTAAGHVTTKSYVDGLTFLTAGTGLTLNSGSLSVNASQTQITSVGTLTSLAVSGTATIGTPTLAAHATTKSYVDGLTFLTAGAGLTLNSGSLSVNAAQPQITSVGTLSSLVVSGTVTITKNTQQITFSDTATWGDPTMTTRSLGCRLIIFPDLSSTRVDYALGVGTSSDLWFSSPVRFSWFRNATKIMSLDDTALTLSSTTDSTSISTGSVITPGGLAVAKNAYIGLSVNAATGVFSGTVSSASPTLAGHVATKAYVDGLTFLTAGTGLTMTTGTLSVNATQAQITSVGTLGSLAVSGASVLSGAVTVPTPTLTGHATTKAYVDGLTFLTAGTGLTMTTGSLSVNATQAQITSVGTLSSLAVLGITNVSNTTQLSPTSNTVSTSTGGFTVAGDVHLYNGTKNTIVFSPNGVAPPSFATRSAGSKILIFPIIGSAAVDYAIGMESNVMWFSAATATDGFKWYGGTTMAASLSASGGLSLTSSLTVSGASTLSGAVSVPTPTLAAHATTKAYVDGLAFLTAGTGLTMTTGTLSVNAAQNQITSVGTLASLTISGSLSSGALTSTTGLFSGIINAANATKLGTTSNIVSASTGSLTLAGDLHMYHATNPQLVFFAGSVAVPTFTNRSAGSRIILFPNVSSTATDYAIGVESSNLWFSTAQSSTGFKWYGGTTLSAILSGSGSLTLTQGITATTGIFSGTVTTVIPTLAAHATTKSYVDGLTYLTPGTGLTLNSGTLSVNASQTQITSVGTLSSLAISGNLTSSTGTFSTLNVSNGGVFLTPGTYNGEIARFGSKAEIGNYHLRIVEENISDHTFCTSGGGSVLRFANSGISIFLNTTDSSSSTSGSVQVLGGVGIAKNLSVSGAGVFSGTVSSATPTTTGHVTTKAYVDGLTYLTAGTGLALNSGTLSVNASQTQITSVGTLGSLAVSGNFTSLTGTFSGGLVALTPNLYDGTIVTFASRAEPNVIYIKLIEENISDFTWVNGIGPLLRMGNVTCTFLNITDSTSISSGAVVVNGGIGVAKNIYAGLSVNAATGIFSGNISCAVPSLAAHATTKAYVDGLTFLTAGTGLTMTTGTLSVNTAQIFTSLYVSGNSITGISAGSTEAYTLTSSSRALYSPAGTVLEVGSTPGNITGSTLINLYATNSSNGYSGVYLGIVAANTSGAGNFVVGRRTSTTAWAESLRVDTAGKLTIGGDLAAVNGTLASLTVTGSISSGALASTTGVFSGITNAANATKLANTSNTVNATSGSLTLAGDLHVYHATNPQLVFFTGTTTAPTFTTRSAGTRVILFPNISSTTVDYAMGMESGNLWLSTGQTTTGFKWYGGTTLSASLTGAGQLTLTQGLTATTGAFSGVVSANNLTIGNAYLTTLDGGNQLLISGGTSNTSRYLVIRPYTPDTTSSLIQYTAGSFYITKSDGVAQSMYIDNSTGNVTIDGLIVTRNINGSGQLTLTQGLTATTGAFSGAVSTINLTIGNAYLTTLDGGNQLLISGGTSNTNRYLVIRPYTPVTTSSLIQYTAGSFYITKSDGVAQSMFIDNSTGNVTIDGLTVTRTVTASTVPSLGGHLANKTYVDGLSYLTAGTGLTKTAGTLSVNAAQSQITSVGTLSSLAVSGASTFSGSLTISQNTQQIIFTNTATFADPTVPARSNGCRIILYPSLTPASTIDYAIGVGTVYDMWFSSPLSFSWYKNTTRVMYLNDGTLNINPTAQVGLQIAGSNTWGTYIALSNSTSSGSWQIYCGGSDTGNSFSGGNMTIYNNASGSPALTISKSNNTVSIGPLNVTGTSIFSGTVTVPTPTNGTDATTKSYVDGLTFLTAGTGLTKASGTLSVNAAQTQITSIGTLSSLNISGGTMTVLSQNLYDGTLAQFCSRAEPTVYNLKLVEENISEFTFYTTNGTSFPTLKMGSGITTFPNSVDSTSPSSGAVKCLGGVGIVKNCNVGGTLTTNRINAYGTSNQIMVGNSVTAGGEASIAFLANSTGTVGTGTQTGWALGYNTGSIGQGNFAIYGTGISANALSIQNVDNSVKLHSTIDSNSSTSGALQVLGGVGIAKNLFVNGTISTYGNITASTVANATGTSYISTSLLTGNYGAILSGGLTQSVGPCAKFDMYAAGTFMPIWSIDGSTPQVVFKQTANSTSTGSGSVVFLGGVGMQGDLYGVNANLSGGLTISKTTQQITFSDTITWGDPTLTTRSNGCRLIVFPNISPTTVDYAIGVGASNDLWVSSPNKFSWFRNATKIMSLDATSLTVTVPITATGVLPSADATYDIGTSALRWRSVYASNGLLQTSDERLKANITLFTPILGLSFIDSLIPVTFKLVSDLNGKQHMGLIAQDVDAILTAIGKDLALLHKDAKTGMYSMNYMQMIAPLIKAVQELSSRVAALELKAKK